MTAEPTYEPTLTGDDLMPVGKYAGQPMKKVPAKWLHWYWWEHQADRRDDPVMIYVRSNIDDLQLEYPGVLWE